MDWSTVLKQQFSQDKTLQIKGADIKKVERCLSLPFWKESNGVREILGRSSTSVDLKSVKRAKNLRLTGNDYFKKANFKQSLDAYNQALILAPFGETDNPTPEIAFCYGNRSAVLFHLAQSQPQDQMTAKMTLFNASAADITRAVHHGYPESQVHKLYRRQGLAYMHAGRADDACKAFEESIKSSSLITDTQKKECIIIELKSFLEQCQNKNVNKMERLGHPQCNNFREGQNQKLWNASKKVVLKYREDKGRHLVASDDISMGETIIEEEPFAGVLLRTESGDPEAGSHCHHCYQFTQAPLPCPQCTKVRYCTEECRDQAWQTYHGTECRLWETLQTVGSFGHLALRIVLTAGPKKALEWGSKLSKYSATTTLSTSIDETYKADYQSVFSLMTHTENHSQEELFQHTMTACLLAKCTHPILSLRDTWKEVKVERLAGLVLRHLQQLKFNVHAITTLVPDPSAHAAAMGVVGAVETTRQVRVASAIYPTASLLNHSCDPNTIISYRGNRLTAKATRVIACDREILHCYGPQVGRMAREERQQALSRQYFFTCACSGCQSPGPVQVPLYRCPDCGGPAASACSNQQCSRPKLYLDRFHQIEKQASALFVQAEQLLELGQAEKSIELLKRCHGLQLLVLSPTHTELAKTKDLLARSYASLQNWRQSASYLEQSIPVVEAIYGSGSIEVANELHKLAGVLFNGQEDAEKIVSVINRAVDIFTVNYGDSYPAVIELLKMKLVVKNPL